jgi:membrane associated rhomboid family serine protease
VFSRHWIPILSASSDFAREAATLLIIAFHFAQRRSGNFAQIFSAANAFAALSGLQSRASSIEFQRPMFPLKSLAPRRAFPFVTLALIGINVYIFLQQVAMRPRLLNELVNAYGLVPARFANLLNMTFSPVYGLRRITPEAAILPLLTSLFLHASWLHIIGNMWFLWIFGQTVEDALGHFPFLLFYLACGVAAGLTHVAFNLNSKLPTIGASGAISGVLGAYLVLYPGAQILTLVPIIVIPLIVRLPAVLFIGLWFVFQFLGGLGTLQLQDAGGVAFWAHVGGFIAGMFLAAIARNHRRVLPANYY